MVGKFAVAARIGFGFRNFANFRIQVYAVALEFEIERHVVNARAQVVDLVDRHTDIFGEDFGCPLHAVTQANSFDFAGFVDRPGIHRHRVDVLQESHIRADSFHVFADVEKDGDGAQSAHDASDAERISDGLFDPIFFGNLKVDDGAGFIAANLEHADGIVCAIEGGAAVERGFDLRFGTEEICNFVCHDLGGL